MRLYADDCCPRCCATSPPPEPSRRCARPRASWWPKASPSPRNLPAAIPRPASGPPTRRPAPRRGRWRPRCMPASPRCATHCPMNLRISLCRLRPPAPRCWPISTRLETLWAWARDQTGATGRGSSAPIPPPTPSLRPVAGRIAGYDLPVGAGGAGLCRRPSRRTRPSAAGARWAWSMARTSAFLPRATIRAAPGPARRRCPPAPSTAPTPRTPPAPIPASRSRHVLELNGRRFGFCNAFCRDKTVADPEAWPKFMALVG